MRRITGFLIVLVLFAGACSSKKHESDPSSRTTQPDNGLTFFTGAPPWALADRQADRMARAGLPQLTAEGTHVHFHAHLDVFDNGEAVKVPAGVGIDFDQRVISPLHTHFDTGVMHVEAETNESVTLGQFLTEWGVRVTDECIGNVCDADKIALFVNGARQSGDPRDYVIKPDQELALVLGTPPASIPKGYQCVNPQDACPDTPAP